MAIYTEEQLNRLCNQYQELLRIQDWKIEVRLVHQSEIQDDSGDLVEGRHNSELINQVSLIRIPTAESWTPTLHFKEQDMHLTLLHELVHVVFSSLGPNDKENSVTLCTLWELGVEKIAQALQSLLPEPDFGDDDGTEKGSNNES